MSERPKQVSLFFDAAHSTSSEVIDLHIWVFPGLSDAVEASTSGVHSLHRETKFIIGFDFAVTLSSPASSFCVLFDITWEQVVELKWLMINKHNKWFQSSRLKFPLVSMSASGFLVSMFLIWIFGSKLIRSNNQSSATLWVLETCLIVGLLPFIVILITASLSSNTYNKASWWRELTFEGIKSTLSKSLIIPWDCFRSWIVWGVERTSRLFVNGSLRSLWLWFVFPRTATIRSHKSSAGTPPNLSPASKEMISESVELCTLSQCRVRHHHECG